MAGSGQIHRSDAAALSSCMLFSTERMLQVWIGVKSGIPLLSEATTYDAQERAGYDGVPIGTDFDPGRISLCRENDVAGFGSRRTERARSVSGRLDGADVTMIHNDHCLYGNR